MEWVLKTCNGIFDGEDTHYAEKLRVVDHMIKNPPIHEGEIQLTNILAYNLTLFCFVF